MALPKKIYVYEELDGKEIYLIAHSSIDDIRENNAGTLVGVYELKSASKLSVKKSLESK